MLSIPTGTMSALIVGNARKAAQAQAREFQLVEVTQNSALDGVFDALKRGRADALLVPGDGIFFALRAQIAERAREQRLPAIFSYTEGVEAGGLMSYSPSSTENYRRAAGFIDKILRGMKPGEIPIEQPTKFELALNLKTAKALGLTVPQSLLLRADRIIE
jgi:putative ABC transport system substrate-binding protein